MLFITDSEFERIVSRARNRMLSHRYFDNGCVTRVYIEETNQGYEIRGSVFVNGHLYSPYIETNRDSKIIYTRCQCIFSDEYTACAHIGALLLAVQDLSPDEFPFNYEYDQQAIRLRRQQQEHDFLQQLRKQAEERRREALFSVSDDLLNDMRNNLYTEFTYTPMSNIKLYISLEKQYHYYIRFKIGQNRYYIIKNISQFLRDMKDKAIVKYGKELTYKHDISTLDESSQKIYDYISTHYNSNMHAQYFNFLDSIDAFCDVLRDLPQEYSNINYHEEEIKIPLSTKMDDYGMILTMDMDDDYEFGDHTIISIQNNSITAYPISKQAMTLIKTLYDEDQLYIRTDKIDYFYKYVLAPIKDYFVFDYHFEEENSIEIYCDIDEDEMIRIEVDGIYEDKENALTNNKPHSFQLDMILDYLKQFTNDYDDYYYIDSHSEEVDHFLDSIPFLMNYADVFVSEQLKHFHDKNHVNVNVGLTIHQNLLDIDVDISDIPKEEMIALLQSVKRKKRYHKLKNGELLSLNSDELQELDELMDRYHLLPKDLEDGHFYMNASKAYDMDLYEHNLQHIHVSKEDVFKETIDRLKNYKVSTYPINDYYSNILRDYQKEGYQWLSTMNDLQLGGILADDMGLGKTIQILSLLEHQDHHFSIVVCPSSLILNWLDEIHKFSKLKPMTIMGTAKNRQELIKEATKYDILITSYDYMRRDIEYYKDLYFDYIILDEAQYIKNQNTKNARSVKKLQGIHKFALTGTPIENSLAELWSIFDFLEKDYLYNYHYFKKTYESPIIKDHDEKKQEELKNLISPFILRRTKKEVLKELPDKIEDTITIKFHSDERKLYYAYLAQANKLIHTSDKIEILAQLTKLRQICADARLIDDSRKQISSKMEGCLDIIESYKENHKKIIVFSAFKQLLELLAIELDKRDISYHVLTGSTSKIQRKTAVDSFQSDDSTVFLISLKAGGTGLNLTAAEGVIHYDPWWNMSAQLQATDRTHRIGQENKVFVYKLIMKDSIEEKIQKLQLEKQNLSDTFVENDVNIRSMTNEQLIELFKEES